MSKQQLFRISKNIRKYGQEKDFSRDRLLKERGVVYNTIVKIESVKNPNSTIDTLERIAKALGVSIEKLFKE